VANLADESYLFSLTLEELIQLKVAVAEPSGEESIINTPAVVSRYDTKSMAKFGHQTLIDVLNAIPGVEVKVSNSGNFTVFIRGLQDVFNQKVLFLLDGTPYYQFTHSLIPLSGIPIEGISHIEVIRGPGSVIYGTNASAGVINIVTKKEGDNTIALSMGSHDYKNLGGYLSGKLKGNNRGYIAFEKQTGGQFNSYFDRGFSTLDPGEVELGNEASSVISGINWGNTNLSFSAFKVINTGINTEANTSNNGEVTENSTFFHIDHLVEIQASKIKLYADYNNYHHSFEFDNSVAISPGNSVRTEFKDSDKNYRLRSGANVSWQANQYTRVFIGAEYETRSTGNYHSTNLSTGEPTALLGSVLPESDISESSIYSQLDYTYGKVRLTSGLRFTNHETAGDYATPKASIVYNLTPESSLKFLYSVGFNSPNGIQTGITGLPIVVGNSDLKPEIITTYDLAYSYSEKNTLFVANLYALKVTDGIDRKANSSGPGLVYVNSNEFEHYGIELDFQKSIKRVMLFSNLSYLHDANSVSTSDTSSALSPEYIFAFGSHYALSQSQQIGLSYEFKTERKTASGDKSLKASHLANINYQYQHDNLQFFVTLNNILGSEIREPDVNKTEMTLQTKSDTTGFIAGIKATF
jgi:outer membrane receptor protein involved in Fe transport